MLGPSYLPIHVTVATAGRLQGLSLTEELRLVKAALLYADQVTVASLGTASLGAAAELLRGSDAQRARRMMDVASALMDPEQQRVLGLLQSRKARRAIRGYRELEASLTPFVREIEGVVEGMRTESGAAELDAAVSAGILRIEPLDLDPVAFIREAVLAAKLREDGIGLDDVSRSAVRGAAEPAIRSLLQIIGRTIAPNSDTFPLFDNEAGDIVRDMIKSAHSQPVSRLPAVQSGLAATFIGTLPAFPDATVSEIVDVRRGIERSLIEFRSAVAGMATEVHEAAWDPGFHHEAQALFIRTVQPALRQVEENLKDLGAASLAKHVALSPSPYVAGATTIGLALAGALVVPDLAAAALSLGTPLTTIAAAAAEGIKERYRRENLVKRNQFLWLYQVGQKLGSSATRR